MESAAIAQTARRNGVPFAILRAISDKADNSAQMDYPTFEAMIARRCAAVTPYRQNAMGIYGKCLTVFAEKDCFFREHLL